MKVIWPQNLSRETQMLTIIKPNEFTLVPWKNGLGHTTELAINEGGNLDSFDWRLSIASVVANGEFSNFSGYQRNLVLIEGHGLTLDHQNGEVDELIHTLDIARFDGGCQTIGALSSGPIKDFNVITNKEKITANVQCYCDPQQIVVKLNQAKLCFAYSLTDEIEVESTEQKITTVSVGNLVKLSTENSELKNEPLTFVLQGKNIIVIELTLK